MHSPFLALQNFSYVTLKSICQPSSRYNRYFPLVKKVFRDYAEVNEKLLEGFTVAEVLTGINEEDSGMMLELERTIDNVTIGVDVIYNPICTEDSTPLMISQEYVKQID